MLEKYLQNVNIVMQRGKIPLEEAAPPKALSRTNSERSVGREANVTTPRPALVRPRGKPAALAAPARTVKASDDRSASKPADERSERSDKSERSEKGEKIEKTEKTEKKEVDKNSKEYIRDKTKGYVVVTDFSQVHPGDHIRYQGANGKFHHGGFIWYKKVNAESGRTFWMVGQSKRSDMANVKHFPLYWDKVKVVWRKLDQDTDLLRKSIDTKQHYINDIALFLAKKYGDEFKSWMNSREEQRRAKAQNA